MAEPSRRELIVKVADRLFRHYGPQKTTMADVARESGIGVGSVYLEFPSKDALLQELSAHHYRGVLEAMHGVAEDDALTAPERLVFVLQARAVAFRGLLDEGAHACDLLHCGSEAVKAAQGSFHEEEREILAAILEEGRRDGAFDIDDVEATVRVLVLAYASFAPPWIFKTDQKRLDADINAMHELVLHGLLRRIGGKQVEPESSPALGPTEGAPRASKRGK
jgi:AcrR family transcriptional regulator